MEGVIYEIKTMLDKCLLYFC